MEAISTLEPSCPHSQAVEGGEEHFSKPRKKLLTRGEHRYSGDENTGLTKALRGYLEVQAQPVLEELLLALLAAQRPVALHAQLRPQNLGACLVQAELAVPVGTTKAFRYVRAWNLVTLTRLLVHSMHGTTS